MERRAPWAVLVLLALAAAAQAAPLAVSRPLEVAGPTGLRATIHGADEIGSRWLVHEDGRTFLRHPDAGEVELAVDEDPSALVPVDVDAVAAALEAVQGFRTELRVRVFVLPSLPAGVMGSFARRDAIFLAPQFGRPAAETLAYLVAHELGHVLCWHAVDGRPARWERYRELRGLGEQDDPASVPHAERHREIIAEDFRFLFGGELATISGTIENATLPLPDMVPGLRDLLVEYLASAGHEDRLQASTVYPNPCREQARVELSLATGSDKTIGAAPVLEIYDVRGRLVRRVRDGGIANGRATVTWDGRGNDGRRAASGLYLYRIRAGRDLGSGRLLLIDR
ncbi:T9SS type A sorting domain-containing protein [bacterium]|nr:T9SS type A sorting domain-containing protein [bacterium]